MGPNGPGVGGRFGSRALTSILVALVVACKNPQPPAACGTTPQVTIHTGESAAVTACFSDPNEDMLTYSAMSSNAGVATASMAGTDITVKAHAPGSASVSVTATDPGGLQGQQSFQVMVPNRPPLAMRTIPPITVAVGATESVDASSYFAEPDGEALVYSATSSNPAVAAVSVSGSAVSVTAVAKGMATVTVTATDPGGLGTTQDFRTMVPNRQPVPTGTISDQTVEVGEPVAVDLSPYFSDPDGDTLTYAARSSSPGLATVTVTGPTLVITAVAKGTTTVKVTATDPEGLEATQTFESTIPNRPPGPTGTIPEQTLHIGETITVDLSPYFYDPDGDALTHTARATNPGLASVSVTGSTLTITAVAKGTTTAKVTATDPQGLEATQTFQSTIPNRPPGPTGMIPEQTLYLGDTVTVDLSPYFDDPDGDALTYSARSSSSGVATATVVGSTLAITAVAKGTTTVTVTATDPEGLEATQTFLSTIPNRPPGPTGMIPEQTLYLGDTVAVDLSPYFDDPDGDALTYSARSSTSGVATATVAGSTLAITAAAKGTTTVTVTATDPEGLEATQTFQSTVPNRPPGPTGTIPEQTLHIGDTVTLDLSPYFDDPDGDALTHSVRSSTAGPASVSVTGSILMITAVAKGTTTVTVTATDPEGLEATQTFQSTVPNRPPGPTGTIPEQTLYLGDTVTADLSPYFDDPDGDILTYAATSTNSAVATASVSGSTLAIAAVTRGATTVTVTATDPEGLETIQTFQCTIPNRPPGPTGTIPEQTLHIGDMATVDLPPYFDDPDGDELTFIARSANSGVAAAAISGSAVTITAVGKGTTTVTVTATDPEGLTATQTIESIVPNRPPGPVGTVPDQTLHVGETDTLDLPPYFDDPDGDELAYTAMSANSGVATAAVSGLVVTITAVARGTATVTVTATDPEGLEAIQTFQSTVPNRPPGPVGTVRDRTVRIGKPVKVGLARYFDDPDGDALTYTAASSNTAVATTSVSGSSVTITGIAVGSATITVTAQDPDGLAATQQAGVTVRQANRAPRTVRSIPATRLAPGHTAIINASEYFVDPDGDDLTYSATTSNSDVARVSVSESTVRIRAVADGSATITVTARDPSGLTATQQAVVRVLENRAPQSAGTIPSLVLIPAETATVNVSRYFNDPDGDALAYTAASSDSSVATASVSGSTVTIVATADGSATITVTARDPGGLTATQRTDVTVTRGDRGFRDDFSSSASLDDWSLTRATAEVNNGVLELTKTNPVYTGTASRVLASPITSWTLAIRMGRGQPSDSAVALVWRTGHPRYTFAGFYIMEDNNYYLLVLDSESHYWTAIDDASGTSDAIRTGAGELTTISISFIDRRLKAVADNTELFNYRTNGLGSAIFARVGYAGTGTAVWLFADGVEGTTASFDWIDIDGDPVGIGFVLDESAALSGIDAHELVKEGPAATMLGTESLEVFRAVRKGRNR